MSGISSVGSSSLPNGGLSSVGASLLSTGGAPNPVKPAAPAPSPTALTSYQTEYINLQQYDNQELLYASFLSPQDALANADSVLQQAAVLLGSPGHPGTLATGASPAPPPVATPPASTSTSSTSTSSSAVPNQPSVASILAASDAAAQQTLSAYANAPAGSSILDFQA